MAKGRGFDRPSLMQALEKGAAALEVELDAGQTGQLIDYLALLVKWNAVYNLTAIRDPEQMLTHHVLDSLAAVPAFEAASQVLDVGAGAGLPGMVLAIWAARARPAMHIAMIDTVHKKTAFLNQVKAELNLGNVTIHTGRVEKLQADTLQSRKLFDVITSRAFADLGDFIAWSGHLLAPGGRFIAMKGVATPAEDANLPPGWKIMEKRFLHVPGLDAERHLVLVERAVAP
ncbi:MAG: 16S rRNA (guanine(527)-N(7))-methyltransferase RsmG [Noviherbaspirillum sp.]